jgi:hypothetical protein
VVDLQATIHRFVAQTNQHPEPFIWTADPDKIIRCQTWASSVRFHPLGAHFRQKSLNRFGASAVYSRVHDKPSDRIADAQFSAAPDSPQILNSEGTRDDP